MVPAYTVIVPTRDRLTDLATCLDALAPRVQALDEAYYEVIVSDDSVADTAKNLVTCSYPWARWIAGPRAGPAANRNSGAQVAAGEWLVFVDDDCIPEPGLLLAYHLTRQTIRVPVIEGRTIAEGERRSIDMEAPVNLTGGLLWSCNFAIERSLFLSMGGFDTGFPGAALEDVEFRTRLQKAAVPIHFTSGAVVKHPWRRTKGWEFAKIYAKSAIYFCAKHPEQAGLFSFALRSRTLATRFAHGIQEALRQSSARGLIRFMSLELLTFLQLSWNQLYATYVKR